MAVVGMTAQCVTENVGSLADVDHDRFGAKRLAPQRQLDDIGGTVQILSGPERRMRKAVGDHHMITNSQVEHDQTSSSPG